ncbi:MAG: SUMF1/EgtB/PvdO family nonheme iron enzyme [Anaerolineae bacterium]|nr:SUMF1/EgtB/PvdO family nonheme iron enzyme [Anaerolineae bacterium]
MNIEWVNVPGGNVTLAAGGYLSAPTTDEVEAFMMARYPVTNIQYAAFVNAGGYTNATWWTDAGWAAKENEQWTEPRYWQSSDWNRPHCPVVGVSWYEAAAFCHWLSAVTGKSAALPTEQQWQHAAQGDDGRDYPWGDEEPNVHVCNWNRYVDETTPVTHYPDGASPYGVMDMAGNVWEWCVTGWDSGIAAVFDEREARMLRGGSWSSDSVLSLRAANRSSKDPNTRLDPRSRNLVTVGFRCVCL